MPTRPLHPCSRCMVNLTASSPCLTCRQGMEHRRGTASQRGYGTMHRKRRLMVLQRDPLCVACEALGMVVVATIYDHIISIDAGGSDEDLDNAQGLCQRCHNVKRAAEQRGRQLQVIEGRGLIDIGPLGTRAVRCEALAA